MKPLSLEERRAQASQLTEAAIQSESGKGPVPYVPGDRGLRHTVVLGADIAEPSYDAPRFVRIEARLAVIEEQLQSQSGALTEFTHEKEIRERVARHHEESFIQADKHFVAIETRLTRQAELEASYKINSEQARLLIDKRLAETVDQQQLHADVIFSLENKTNTNRDQVAALGKRIDERLDAIERRQSQQAEDAASNRAADERAIVERFHQISNGFDQVGARIEAIEGRQRAQDGAIHRLEARPKTWAEVFVLIRKMIKEKRHGKER